MRLNTRVRAGVTVVCLLLLGCLVGCSGASSPSAAPAPPASSTQSSAKALWTLVRSAPGSSSVVVAYTFESCADHPRARVTGQARSVRILIRGTEPQNQGCGLDATIALARIHLGQPLGHRRLLGACDLHARRICRAYFTPLPSVPVPPRLPSLGT